MYSHLLCPPPSRRQPARATAGAAASSSSTGPRGILGGPREAWNRLRVAREGRVAARPAAVGRQQCSAASPDAIAAGVERVAEQTPFFANTPGLDRDE
jgi:hypothetical protein